MKKVIVAYISRTGKTEKMAEYVAEGIRFLGNTVNLKKISQIKDEKALEGYDGYVFGCPTYHRDITEGMKTFLFIVWDWFHLGIKNQISTWIEVLYGIETFKTKGTVQTKKN